MQRNISESNRGSDLDGCQVQEFIKVRDGRKQPIRGLWRRKEKFYAQLALEDSSTGVKKVRRVLLTDPEHRPVKTVAEAQNALRRLKTQRENGDVPVLGRTPKFNVFVKHYLDTIQAGQGTKKPGTITNEKSQLAKWVKALGERRLDRIRPVDINAHCTQRLNAGVSPRTVNTDVIVLRNVLNLAKDEKFIKTIPEYKWLKSETTKRELFTPADLEKLCAAAMGNKADGEPVTKNGQQLCDFLRLLAFSGCREQEALGLRWQDVDFDRQQLTVGAEGDTKNRSCRVVDFNPNLERHLKDMDTRKAPDSEWIFPSPQRGQKDIHALTLRVSLGLARQAAAERQEAAGDRPTLATKAFHDLRHHFISYAVMSGIDFMSIASWVGHRDGGILIGKVYGHLADSHKKAQAQRLNFGPTVVPLAEAVAQ